MKKNVSLTKCGSLQLNAIQAGGRTLLNPLVLYVFDQTIPKGWRGINTTALFLSDSTFAIFLRQMSCHVETLWNTEKWQ